METKKSQRARQLANSRLRILSAPISEDIIRQKAYELYKENGNVDSIQNWLEAERFLKS